MVTIYLKDAYHSVAISRLFHKFLKIKYKDKLQYFTCFPNGLRSCPKKFAKLQLHILEMYYGVVILMAFLLKQKLFQYMKKTHRKQCACMTSWVLS